jgi:hypothetical protein
MVVRAGRTAGESLPCTIIREAIGDELPDLKQSQMVRILRLQRTHQDFKLRKTAQILETRVFHKKRPARESSADASLKPFKRLGWPPQYGENTGDLIIGMVGVSKRFWAGAGPSQALQCAFVFTRQGVKEAEQTDDEWIFRQESHSFIEQEFRLFPIPCHHG